jgi:hypothetical protein
MLSHEFNPDLDKGYWERPIDSGKAQLKDCRSMRHASLICQEYIERNGLGSGNWTGGAVFNNGVQIGRVSYNGRKWNMNGEEIV